MQCLALNHRLRSLVLGALVVGVQPLETKSEEAPRRVAPVASQIQTAPYGTDPMRQPAHLSGRPPDSSDSPQAGEFSPQMVKKLMRPSWDMATEWQADTNDIGFASYDARVNFPTYPIFGPPPPLIDVGFVLTDIEAPLAAGLPAKLYETNLGLAWMRRVNDRWMMRFMAGTSPRWGPSGEWSAGGFDGCDRGNSLD